MFKVIGLVVVGVAVFRVGIVFLRCSKCYLEAKRFLIGANALPIKQCNIL